MNRSWLLLTLPVAVLALGALGWTVRSLIRAVRGAVVLSVPALPRQVVRFEEPGEYALNIEADSLTAVISGLQFTLVDTERRTTIALEKAIVRTRVSSFSRARRELYVFTLGAAGSYVLRVEGAGESLSASHPSVVFTRRFHFSLVLHILALVAAGALLIGSLVGTGLILSGRAVDSAAAPPRASQTLEGLVARSAAIVRVRRIADGGPARYALLETLRGVVPGDIARAGSPEGLLLVLDTSEEQVVFLPPTTPPQPGAAARVTLGEPIASLPVRGSRVDLPAEGGSGARTMELDELRKAVAP